MDVVAGSGNDEFYTPRYAVEPILKYISNDKTVWCPFDTDDSNFVKMLKERGNYVINTHLQNGVDFFNCEIPECDVILSNPPYSLKNEVFAKLFEIKKPFAMLVGVVGMFESKKRFNMFQHNKFEVLYLDKRVSYFKNFSDPTPALNPPFQSVYITSNILPQQICFQAINKTTIKG